MQTLSTVITKLTQRGYEVQFKVTDKGLLSLSSDKVYNPEQVKICHFYRFEGESNPSDNSILYAIETQDGEKGTLVDGYGASSDELIDHFIKQVEKIEK
jgi:hypothetical protein